jgi:hypothetical protein
MDSLPFVVTFEALAGERLMSLGGTGHWFHFAQLLHGQGAKTARRLKQLAQQPDGPGTDTVYVVFREELSAASLNAFTRMLTVAVLTGGHFRHVVFGSTAQLTRFADEKREVNGGGGQDWAVVRADVKVAFAVDTQQGTDVRFMADARGGGERRGVWGIDVRGVCGRELLQKAPHTVRGRYKWFDTLEDYKGFRSSIGRTCSLDMVNEPLSRVIVPAPSDEVLMPDSQSMVKCHSWCQEYGLWPVPPVPVLSMQGQPKTVVIYQRNLNRRFTDVGDMARSLMVQLGPSWSVRVVQHDPTRAPCDVIQSVKDASVLVTVHGFQSLLLNFQPLQSVFVEVHPNGYVVPDIYGTLQVNMRRHLGLARSFVLVEGAQDLSAWTPVTAAARFCRHYLGLAMCRHLLRNQEVHFGNDPARVAKVSKYILTHMT